MKLIERVRSHAHWKTALLWLCFLGPFFFISYGWANHHTAALPRVGSFVYGWEKHIPFLAWTIIPYWSIDLLYGLSLFVCADRVEVHAQAKRLFLATAVCVAGFLLFPLRFSFDKPAIDTALFAWLFDALGAFDLPYNQAPSLHICLLVIIWSRFRAHMRGMGLPLWDGWCLLIGISVLTTFQHHAIDLITGIPAGLFCCLAIPEQPIPARKHADLARSRRLALFYALPAVSLLAAACWLGGWAWLLLWPGVTLAGVSLAYLWLGPLFLGKIAGTGDRAGSREAALAFLLAPWVWGSRLYRRLAFSVCVDAVEVHPGIWVGGYPNRVPQGVTGILDLAAEYSRSPAVSGCRYASIPMLDMVPPSRDEVKRAMAAYEDLRGHGPVLIHCALGLSRSVLVTAFCLMREGACPDLDTALTHIAARRPGIVVSASTRGAVAGFGAEHA